MAGAVTPDGNYVISIEEFWHAIVQPEQPGPLSLGATVTGAALDENTNTTVAFAYADSELSWQLLYILDEGDEHLEVKGTPPVPIAPLIEDARRIRAEDCWDTFSDIPLNVALQMTGFRLDARHDLVFHRLEVCADMHGWHVAPRRRREIARSENPLPADRDLMSETLMAALGAVLQRLGFVLDIGTATPNGPELAGKCGAAAMMWCERRCDVSGRCSGRTTDDLRAYGRYLLLRDR